MSGMVISHDLKFIFLGIPRTANRAMHRALMQLPGTFAGLLHEMGIPKECRDYFTFCCVRNPYRRFLAYYRWRIIDHPWGCEAKDMEFEQYIEAMEQGKLGPTTVRGHTQNNRLDLIFRFEDLPDSFRNIRQIPGIKSVDMPTCGRKLSRHWKLFYNEETADRVYQLCKPDFDEFGYDVDSWKTTPELV